MRTFRPHHSLLSSVKKKYITKTSLVDRYFVIFYYKTMLETWKLCIFSQSLIFVINYLRIKSLQLVNELGCILHYETVWAIRPLPNTAEISFPKPRVQNIIKINPQWPHTSLSYIITNNVLLSLSKGPSIQARFCIIYLYLLYISNIYSTYKYIIQNLACINKRLTSQKMAW